jgi:hypothetical protein
VMPAVSWNEQYHRRNHHVVRQGDSSTIEHDCKGEQEFFWVYCRVGVLKMLPENAECHLLDGLDAIMSSCDASILNEIPNDIAKLTTRIVKRWWTSHGLPYVTDAFRVEPKVGILVAYCGVWRFLVLNFVSLCRCRQSVLAGVNHELLLMSKAHPRAPARTAQPLMKMLVLLVTEPMIKAMVPLAMVAKIFLILVNKAVRYDWVVIFGL